jgi:hypothetical protein
MQAVGWRNWRKSHHSIATMIPYLNTWRSGKRTRQDFSLDSWYLSLRFEVVFYRVADFCPSLPWSTWRVEQCDHESLYHPATMHCVGFCFTQTAICYFPRPQDSVAQVCCLAGDRICPADFSCDIPRKQRWNCTHSINWFTSEINSNSSRALDRTDAFFKLISTRLKPVGQSPAVPWCRVAHAMHTPWKGDWIWKSGSHSVHEY